MLYKGCYVWQPFLFYIITNILLIMATKRQHVYAVLRILNQGVRSDDSSFTPKEVEHHLNMARGTLIKRRMDKKHVLSDNNYLTYCDTLSPSKFFDCDCISHEFDCLILKSSKKIPEYITSQGKISVEVRNPFSGELIDYASLSSTKLAAHSLTASDTPTWFIHNQYLYVTKTLTLDTVLVRLIPENPDVLRTYQSCSSENGACYDPQDDDYPIDTDLVQPMYKMTLELLAPSLNSPKDTENNARAAVVNNDRE